MVKPHILKAHTLWASLLKPHDHVIDATCGNGHDTLYLTTLVPQGKIYAIDIQKEALLKTRLKLEEAKTDQIVEMVEGSHENFPEKITPNSIQLIVYNLGYLPHGNKSVTTELESTLKSLKQAFLLLQEGGAISMTLYPGHPEGEREKEGILDFLKDLDRHQWEVEYTSWINRLKSPEFIFLKKLIL